MPEERLWSLMAACDVVVDLRAPTMGETSGVAMRALSLGRPLVVSDVGWFAELPDDVALKVPVDEREVGRSRPRSSCSQPTASAASAMGAAARDYAEREHGLDRVADLYAAALEEAAGGGAVREAVVGEVARAAADVGIEADDPLAAELAERLREVARRRVAPPRCAHARGARPVACARARAGRGSAALVVVSAARPLPARPRGWSRRGSWSTS